MDSTLKYEGFSPAVPTIITFPYLVAVIFYSELFCSVGNLNSLTDALLRSHGPTAVDSESVKSPNGHFG